MRSLLVGILLTVALWAQDTTIVVKHKNIGGSAPTIAFDCFYANTAAAPGTPATTSSCTATAGDLFVVLVAATATVTDPGVVTDSLSELTYSQVARTTQASGNSIYAFVSDIGAQSSTARTITFSPGADPDTGTIIHVYKVSNMHVYGLTAVVQYAVQASQAGGGTPGPVFTNAVSTSDPVIGFLASAATTPTVVAPPTGFSVTDAENPALCCYFITPNQHLGSIYSNSGFSGTTLSWTATSAAAFGDIVMELTAALGVQDAPTATPAGFPAGTGYYATDQTVSLNGHSADYVCYTIDTAGGTPSDPAGTPSSCTTGTHYTGSLSAVVAGPTTIKAKGFKTSYLASSILSAKYTNVPSNTWTTSTGWSAAGVTSASLTCGDGIACTPATTIPATVAGDVLYIETYTGSIRTLTAVSAGGSWVIPANCSNAGGKEQCAYVLSATGGITSIQITFSVNITGAMFNIRSYHPSAQTAVAETVPAANSLSCGSNCAAPNVTITGTNDLIISAMATDWTLCGLTTPSSFDNFLTVGATNFGIADNLSSSTGNGGVFTQASGCPTPTTSTANGTSVAFK
jgi:hypothetical protein